MNPFQVMSEPIRRRLVEVLASGEHTAGELCDVIETEFGVTRSAVSRHLRILRNNEWVIMRAEWCNRLYRLDDTAIRRLRKDVRRLEKLWDRRIGIIARHDPVPWHTEPIDKRKRPRAKEGAAKGLRGAGVRDDLWQGEHIPPAAQHVAERGAEQAAARAGATQRRAP